MRRPDFAESRSAALQNCSITRVAIPEKQGGPNLNFTSSWGISTTWQYGPGRSRTIRRPAPDTILLRSVRWADDESGERQWLKRVSTTERPDGTVVHDLSARGTTSLCFEHGLIFPEEELTVSLPLTPRPDGRHDLLVSFEVGNQRSGPILLPKTFMTSSKEPTIFYPITSERGGRIMRARRSAGEWAIVGGMSSCSAPVGEIYTVRLPLLLPVVADIKSEETGGISREGRRTRRCYSRTEEVLRLLLRAAAGLVLRAGGWLGRRAAQKSICRRDDRP
jgi:hypothetical protein